MRRLLPSTAATTATAATAALALALSGCGGSGRHDTAPTTSVTGPLSPSVTRVAGGTGKGIALFDRFSSCDDLVAAFRTQALDRVTPYGLDGPMFAVDGRVAATAGAATTAAAAAPSVSGASKSVETATPSSLTDGSSITNTQEAGVDEGDQVENDGRHVYSVLSGRLDVVDVITDTRLATVALEPGTSGHQLLLDGSILAVVSQRFMQTGAETSVAVYDVSKPASPALIRSTRLEGTLVAARASDHRARIVLTSSLSTRLAFVHPNSPGAENDALARNTEIINAASADDLLPRQAVIDAAGRTSKPTRALECNQVGMPTEPSGLGVSWVATLDLSPASTGAVKGSGGVLAEGQTVYASTDTLYVATQRWDFSNGRLAPNTPSEPSTQLHAFDLTDVSGARYLASGSVPGHLLNSYAMSQFDGVLRVATTTDAVGFASDRSSGVHTLRRDGERLTELGAVTGLGRSEQIYAVRYVGPLAYLVTFRRTDPLFVVDLHDPAAPKVAGELKMPGYSSYLHPISDTRLIGIGQDADANGRVKGTKLSLFDVSDPANPTMLSSVTLGGSSEAEYDPHAFLWWAPMQRAVVPSTVYPVGLPQPVGTVAVGSKPIARPLVPTNAAQVVDVVGSSLSQTGSLRSHAGDGQIRRTMVVGGRLVAISDLGVTVFDLTTLAEIGWIPVA